jgi:putative endonuclease
MARQFASGMLLLKAVHDCHPRACRGIALLHPKAMPATAGYVYMMAGRNKALYIGVTSNLERRLWQHRTEETGSKFVKGYGLMNLVWFEQFASMRDTIACEKKLKGWRREKESRID